MLILTGFVESNWAHFHGIDFSGLRAARPRLVFRYLPREARAAFHEKLDRRMFLAKSFFGFLDVFASTYKVTDDAWGRELASSCFATSSTLRFEKGRNPSETVRWR